MIGNTGALRYPAPAPRPACPCRIQAPGGPAAQNQGLCHRAARLHLRADAVALGSLPDRRCATARRPPPAACRFFPVLQIQIMRTPDWRLRRPSLSAAARWRCRGAPDPEHRVHLLCGRSAVWSEGLGVWLREGAAGAPVGHHALLHRRPGAAGRGAPAVEKRASDAGGRQHPRSALCTCRFDVELS